MILGQGMTDTKEKKYVIDVPKLMAEWNWKKNDELGFNPNQLTLGSGKKVWWKCSKGHEWQARIADRNSGKGCPFCSGQKVLKGYNDLQTVNPTIAKEWNYEKNGDLKPEDFTANSGKKIWWKCSKGHEWLAIINHRNHERGCPYCSGQKVLKGYNDLQTINPTIAKEWNYERNGGLKPEDFTANSNKKVWWKCSKGHEWQATIFHRNKGNSCPVCSSERHTSFPEYAIVFYLKKYGLETIHSYKKRGYELDVYIPSKNIAIEYDGFFWHKNKTKKDLEKNSRCKKDGIKLYRIREELSPLNDSSIDYIVYNQRKNLSTVLEKLLSEILGINVNVDLEKDAIAIESLREFMEKVNSLLSFNSKLAKEWNYEKNINLKPEHITANSHKKVWWKCNKGHEWQATVVSRNKGNGCPYCSGRFVVKTENDLQTINPTLAKEWNYKMNDDTTPMGVMPNSHKKVWWKCSKGHEWQATVVSRNKGRGCPYCSGRYIIKGHNDLQTVHPTLAKEWNYEKNNELTPIDVMPNSHKKVWWKCYKGHEWQATIENAELLTSQDQARDMGTPGVAPKAWIREEEGFYLLKDGDERDVDAELLASKIIDCFNVEHVAYTESKFLDVRVSKCKILTSEEKSIVPMEFVEIYCQNHSKDKMNFIKRKDRYSYYMMNIIDYLVGNVDRHWGNWGFEVDNATNGLGKLYPFMDFNKAFLSYENVEGAICQTTSVKTSQKQAAIEAVQEIGLNQCKEVDRAWFADEKQAEQFFERLSILREMDKNN